MLPCCSSSLWGRVVWELLDILHACGLLFLVPSRFGRMCCWFCTARDMSTAPQRSTNEHGSRPSSPSSNERRMINTEASWLCTPTLHNLRSPKPQISLHIIPNKQHTFGSPALTPTSPARPPATGRGHRAATGAAATAALGLAGFFGGLAGRQDRCLLLIGFQRLEFRVCGVLRTSGIFSPKLGI